MRFVRTVVAIAFLSLPVFAADLKVKVVDPNSSAIGSAQVSVLPAAQTTPVGVRLTSPEGLASFAGISEGQYRLQVLAPGFAPQTLDVTVPQASLFTIKLNVAGATEIVVVTATRTPIAEQDSGASVSTLEAGQLQVMQPVAAADAIRFLPGAVVNTVGQRGGQASLFVRGGDSRYNKVIVDGVPVNDPGGIFDFGVVPLAGAERLEFLRGAQSTLYGSDAMTSVVQVFSQSGSTQSPELRFGADGGNFSTANGFASIAGAHDRFDYNVFGDQFNTQGSGINDDYSNSLQGMNVGTKLTDRTTLRLRARHANSRTGVQGAWKFNGQPLLPPDGSGGGAVSHRRSRGVVARYERHGVPRRPRAEARRGRGRDRGAARRLRAEHRSGQLRGGSRSRHRAGRVHIVGGGLDMQGQRMEVDVAQQRLRLAEQVRVVLQPSRPEADRAMRLVLAALVLLTAVGGARADGRTRDARPRGRTARQLLARRQPRPGQSGCRRDGVRLQDDGAHVSRQRRRHPGRHDAALQQPARHPGEGRAAACEGSGRRGRRARSTPAIATPPAAAPSSTMRSAP